MKYAKFGHGKWMLAPYDSDTAELDGNNLFSGKAMTSNFKVIDVPSDCGMFFDDDSTGYFPQKGAHKRFKKGQLFKYVSSDGIEHKGRVIKVNDHDIVVHLTKAFVPSKYLKD